MAVTDLPPVEMDDEYDAWQAVVAEWRAHPALKDLDLNDATFNPLARAIELWGERLTALRVTQTPEQRAKALDDHKIAYEQVRQGG